MHYQLDQLIPSTDHSRFQSPCSTLMSEQLNESFEIDVKPKPKYFGSPEEKKLFIQDYTRKKKTELCKTFSIVGSCKFGDQCSFAHGVSELNHKQHLHSNYKTKPCKRYFRDAYCPYGPRCQYIHQELKDMKDGFRDYLERTFREAKLPIPIHPGKLEQNQRSDIQRFQNLSKAYNKKLNIQKEDTLLNKHEFKRLQFVEKMCDQEQERVNFELRFLELASRKESENLYFDDEFLF